MYEEGNRKLSLNWGSLVIKLVILAVVVFIICLIVTKVTGNKGNSDNSLATGNTDYITNITAMKDAAFEYFTPSKLPEQVGSTEKLTLSQMLNQKMLIDFTEDGDVCDIDSSYVQTTKTADGNYALKVSLDCGDKSDFIVTTIEEANCTEYTCDPNPTNTDVVVDDTPSDNTSATNTGSSNTSSTNTSTSGGSTTSSSSSSTGSKVTTTVKTTVNIKVSCSSISCSTNNNNNNNHNNPQEPTDEKTRYYKFVRWSEWKAGYSNDPEDENKEITTTTYNYCKPTREAFYSTGYVTDNTSYNKTYDYEIQFLKIDPDSIKGSVSIENKSYFSTGLADYSSYINQNGALYMTGSDGTKDVPISNPTAFRNSALKSSNFSFNVSGVYRVGDTFRSTITINYRNNNGVSPYYASNLGTNVFFVPLKFDLVYTLSKDCVRDTAENKDKYDGYTLTDPKTETTYMHRSPEYKWSTSTSLDGYEYTGIYEDR